MLLLPPLGRELGVIDKGFQFVKRFKVADPARPDTASDQIRQIWIAQGDPAPGCDTVRNVHELLRPELTEVAENLLFQQLSMKFCNTVYVVTADAGDVCHSNIAVAGLLDNRNPLYQ